MGYAACTNPDVRREIRGSEFCIRSAFRAFSCHLSCLSFSWQRFLCQEMQMAAVEHNMATVTLIFKHATFVYRL